MRREVSAYYLRLTSFLAGNLYQGNHGHTSTPRAWFRPAASSLTDLGFEPAMPVGAREPIPAARLCSHRITLRSTRHWRPTPCRPTRRGWSKSIRHIPGATLAASRKRKNPSRLAEKIEREGQPAETVSDYGAAQIAVDSPQAKDAVVAAVKQHFKVLREQDHFASGDPRISLPQLFATVTDAEWSLGGVADRSPPGVRGKSGGAPRLQEGAQRGARGPERGARHEPPPGPSTIGPWSDLTPKMELPLQ